MIQLTFTSEQTKQLQELAYSHPHPMVQRKMHALSMKSANVPHNKIAKSLGLSDNTVHSYFVQYERGGIEELKKLNLYRPTSKLLPYKSTIEEYLGTHYQCSVAQASHTIAQLTGIKRGLTQTRLFLKSIGLKKLKTGSIPAKADTTKQTEFHNNILQPKLDEAKSGKRVVYFVDAAHFVHSLFMAFVWCFTRVFVQSPSGRSRFNVG